MGKYEYIMKCAEIRKLTDEKQYKKALDIINTLNLDKIKQTVDLNLIADVYIKNEEYDAAREVLFRIYEKSRTRRLLYQLVYLSLKCNLIEDAESFYEEYTEFDKNSTDRIILKYCIDKAKHVDRSILIQYLEQLKKEDYMEEWAYELAKLYHKAGMEEACVKECGDIVLWFGEGLIVQKAKLLKLHYVEGLDIIPRKENKNQEQKNDNLVKSISEQVEALIGEKPTDQMGEAWQEDSEGNLAKVQEENQGEDSERNQEEDSEEVQGEDSEKNQVEAHEEVQGEDSERNQEEVQEENHVENHEENPENFTEEIMTEYSVEGLEDYLEGESEVDAIEIQQQIKENPEEPLEEYSVENVEDYLEEEPDEIGTEHMEVHQEEEPEENVMENLEAYQDGSSTDNQEQISEEVSEYPTETVSAQVPEEIQEEKLEENQSVVPEFLTGTEQGPIHFILVDTEASNSTEMIKLLAKELCVKGFLKTSQIAKIYAERLNVIDIDRKAEKLRNGCLLIQQAGDLDCKTVDSLLNLMMNYDGEIVVILEDNEEALKWLFKKNKKLKNWFRYKM